MQTVVSLVLVIIAGYRMEIHHYTLKRTHSATLGANAAIEV
jgi:hypothetical protein